MILVLDYSQGLVRKQIEIPYQWNQPIRETFETWQQVFKDNGLVEIDYRTFLVAFSQVLEHGVYLSLLFSLNLNCVKKDIE